MEILFYILLGIFLYGLLADRTERAIEREMLRRRVEPVDLYPKDDGAVGQQ